MNKKPDLNVNGTVVRVLNIEGADFICISDIAILKNPVEPKDVVKNWMRTRATISFLGLWEKLHNPEFKGVEFDPLLKVAFRPVLRDCRHLWRVRDFLDLLERDV